MSKNKCGYCEGRITNPGFILQKLTALGYEDREFCSKKCFVEFIKKKYKLVKR